MARLNEPPAAPAATITNDLVATESVDALKRRFIRQNRDLAKNNSTQALRIRGLEIEVSRLSAANFDLLERVHRLENDLAVASSVASSDAVKKVREEMRIKLAELTGLLDGIETPDWVDTASKPQVRERQRRRSAAQGKERTSLAEFMRENQMPTINEDKMFPRRTLGADEIQAIRLSDHSSNGSPDLGPPPVAHFGDEEPTRLSSPSTRQSSPKATEEDVLPDVLSVNLETRRKRKDGQPRLEIRRHTALAQSPLNPNGEPATTLRTGAKRKLSDREIERPIKPTSKDDFSFVRRVPLSTAKVGAGQQSTVPRKPAEEDNVQVKAVATVVKPARKVLSERSTNLSPRKALAKSDKLEKDDAEVLSAAKSSNDISRAEPRTRRVSAIPLPSPPRSNIIARVKIEPPPEPPTLDVQPQTPAALDLFSPASSECSAKPTELRDTPPPGKLSTFDAINGSTEGGGRPSRRARSAVNYTEPSLVAKMRRPGSQMADAVTGLQDPRRAMNSWTGRKASRGSTVKPESDDGDVWKDVAQDGDTQPTSPLGQKGTFDSSNAIAKDITLEAGPSVSHNPSVSSAAISALITGSRKPRDPASQSVGIDLDAEAKRMEELDLYDFKESSSPLRTEAVAPTASARLSHRRHSSMPKEGSRGDESARLRDVRPVGQPIAALGGSKGDRAASRRRSMML